MRNERIHQDNVDWTNDIIGSGRSELTPRTNINLDNRLRMWRLTCYIYISYIFHYTLNLMQCKCSLKCNRAKIMARVTTLHSIVCFSQQDETFTYLLWFNGALSRSFHLDLLDTYWIWRKSEQNMNWNLHEVY